MRGGKELLRGRILIYFRAQQKAEQLPHVGEVRTEGTTVRRRKETDSYSMEIQTLNSLPQVVVDF
jgi:hypothetical protein